MKSKNNTFVLYSYRGPVLRYGKTVDSRFTAQTLAKSKREAVANILYQYKKLAKLAATAGGLRLGGEVTTDA